MGTGYTRNDTSNNIADGNIINAADLDGEFDAIESAFGTSGHTHDGTSAEGGPITVLGPVQDFVASATEIKPKTTNTLDIGTSGLLFKDLFLDGVATLGSIKIDNAGTIGSASDGDAIAISSGGVVTFSQAPLVDVTNSTTNAVTDVLGIQVQSSGTPAVGIGSGLTLGVETAAGNVETGGAIRVITTGLTPTNEEIDLVFYSMQNGSLVEAFRYDSTNEWLNVDGSLRIPSGGALQSINTINISADYDASGAGVINLKTNNVLRISIRNNGDTYFYEDGGATIKMDWDATNEYLHFRDDVKASFGSGNDLEIYHDGSNSYIKDVGTGELIFTSNGTGITFDEDAVKITSSSAATTLTLESTDAGAADGPILNLYRNSASPLADDDLARIDFSGKDLGGNEEVYSRIETYLEDPTTNATKARLELKVQDGSGSLAQFVTLRTDTTTNRVVINEGAANIDFVVEGDNNSTLLYADASTDRIGIGTNSPLEILHIQGGNGASGTGANVAADEVLIDNDGDTGLTIGSSNTGTGYLAFGDPDVALRGGVYYDHANDKLGLRSATTNVIEIQNNNFDITGTAPKINIMESDATNENAQLTSSGGNFLIRTVVDDKSSAITRIRVDHTNGDVDFYDDTGANVKFHWDATDERLGIGTQTPETSLHIYQTTAPAILRLHRSGATNAADAPLGQLEFYNSDGSSDGPNVAAKITGASYGASGQGGILQFFSHDGTEGGEGSDPVERMRVDGNGRIGIGTTNPDQLLHLEGTNATGNINPIILRFTDTDTASAVDQIVGRIEFEGRDAGASGVGSFVQGVAEDVSGNQYLAFGTGTAGSASEAMRIDSSGKLLFGKTSDDNTEVGLVVNGNGYTKIVRASATADVNSVLQLNRLTTEGEILVFQKDGTEVGIVGCNTGNHLTIGKADTGIAFQANEVISPYNPTSNAIRDGDINLGQSSGRFKDLYLSGGVYLGGTGSANKLDDYEEGTWTPDNAALTIIDSGGVYVKIGSLVYASCQINYPSNSSSSDAHITGLPFSVNNLNSGAFSGAVSVTNYGSDNIYGFAEKNSNRILIRNNSNNNINCSALSNKFLNVFVVYRTA